MRRNALLAAALLAVAILLFRARLEPIGGHWAVGRSRIGLGSTLVRVGGDPFFQRTTIASGLQDYRFYTPDCVVYSASGSLKGVVILAVCGDRMPVMVVANE